MTEPCEVCAEHPANCRCGRPEFAREQKETIDRLSAEVAMLKARLDEGCAQAIKLETDNAVLVRVCRETERKLLLFRESLLAIGAERGAIFQSTNACIGALQLAAKQEGEGC